MIPLIADNLEAIAEICRAHRIRKLDLFGSAATGEFDPETSDVDFVVDLGEHTTGDAWRFVDFTDALETLLGHRVEVLTDVSIRNPYLRESIDEHRTPVYEAGNDQAVA